MSSLQKFPQVCNIAYSNTSFVREGGSDVKRQFSIAILASILSFGILSIGLCKAFHTISKSTNGKHEAKHIAVTPVPHEVPLQMQGKTASYNPDPGIVSSYRTNLKDTGIVSARKPPRKLDQGITPTYPHNSFHIVNHYGRWLHGRGITENQFTMNDIL
jgi:hypothetical protein